MSIAEILVITIVAFIVFGPDKIPHLARNLAKLLAVVNNYKYSFNKRWDEEVKKMTLEENLKKAETADEKYTSQSQID